MSVFLTQGFLLGLAMGTTCLATCGPIYAPFLLQRRGGMGGSLRTLMGIFAGRFLAYMVFGAVAGIIGAKTAILHHPIFSVAAYGLSAAFLVVSAFVTFEFEKGCIASRWARLVNCPFLLGAITGINFCPSFLVALTKAVLLAGVGAGMLFFMAFFLGTSIYMLPLSALGAMADKKIFRIIGRVAALGVAVWLLYSVVVILAAHRLPSAWSH